MTDFGRRPAAAAANVLPKTGQTASFRTGDDGYYEAGWEGDRFTDNGDGTITDNATGLMWPADFTGPGGNNGNTKNWNDATDWAEALSFAGHDNWKIPNMFEFASLYDATLQSPAFPAIFTVEASVNYWTSTTHAGDTGNAVFVHTNDQHWEYVTKFAPWRCVACRPI